MSTHRRVALVREMMSRVGHGHQRDGHRRSEQGKDDRVIVYALVATAVYDHGVVGVYETEEAAQTAAEEIWPKTDGHHAFRVDVLELDRTYEGVFQYVAWDYEYEEVELEKERARNRPLGGGVPVEIRDMTLPR